MQSQSDSPLLVFWISIKRHLRLATIAGLLTALYTLTMPNFYKSEARLLPVEAKAANSLGSLSSAAAAFGVNVPGGDSSDSNFVDILGSRWLREQLLLTRFQYHSRAWRFGKEREETGTLMEYFHAPNVELGSQYVGNILSVSRDPKSKVISVTAETTSPELSQLIVKRTGKLLEGFLQEKGRTRGSAKAHFAQARLAEARSEMSEAEGNLLRFLESNKNSQSSGDPSVRLKGATLETELRLRQQLVSTIAMNREQALLEEKNDIPILNYLDEGNLPIEKSRPSRSRMVFVMTLLTGVLSWSWVNRMWIKNRFVVQYKA